MHDHRRRGLRAALAGALAACAWLACAPHAHAAAPPVPVLDWQPCHDGFECATADVPRDYDRPAPAARAAPASTWC